MTTSDEFDPDNFQPFEGWENRSAIINFFIDLPHPMALPHGTQVTRWEYEIPTPWLEPVADYLFVTVSLWRVDRTIAFDLSTLSRQLAVAVHVRNGEGFDRPLDPVNITITSEDSLAPITDYASVLQIETPLFRMFDRSQRDIYSDAFERGLQAISDLSESYTLITHDRRFQPITRQTCPFVVPYLLKSTDGEVSAVGQFHVNEGDGSVPTATSELSEKQIEDFYKTLPRVHARDPFVVVSQMSRLAQRDLHIDGDYRSTVIAAFTSCEILFNTLLLSISWEKGMQRSETLPWFTGKGSPQFMQRVERLMPERLGGTWGSRETGGTIGLLFALSDLRNAVVHRAHQPSEREAQLAAAICLELMEFAKVRVAEKRFNYPRTAALFVGAGLQRLGKYSRRMERWMDEHESEPSWLHTFLEWRDEAVPVPEDQPR